LNCRHCAHSLQHVFLDLGFAPPSNAYLTAADLRAPETYFPLKLFVCERCWLVQTEDYARADELFRSDYAYFSSTSRLWLDHAARYCQQISERLRLGSASHVVEVASNDGYLLKNFAAAGIPCLGIEPTASTAAAAIALGVPTLQEFFGLGLAQRLVAEGRAADLVLGNNVFAHVPDINDFTAGIKALLKPDGVVTLEFPHLLELIDGVQFDTVYHEHFSYLSLTTVDSIFRRAGLRIWDVQKLSTHGGSLRVFGCHAGSARAAEPAVVALLAQERARGLTELSSYLGFQALAERVKNGFLDYLLGCARAGKRVGAFGAAAKGNTLLNFAGVKPDLLSFVCDTATSKQGKFLPGSHVPILAPSALREHRPDIVLILPWNIADELVGAHGYVKEWGGEFVTAIPELRVIRNP
jgi:SAM-dependent methyltransferase